MKAFSSLAVSVLLVTTAACGAHRPPQELLDARASYAQAETSAAPKLVPAELHVARESLDRAESKFHADGDSRETRDLAYVAQRKSQRAEALGQAAMARGQVGAAAREKDKTQNAIIAEQRDKLSSAQDAITDQQNTIQQKNVAIEQQKAETEKERQARVAAEQKAKDAMDALSKSLAVKDDARGTVITLSGGVLFATNKATILPGAQASLDKVADALKTQAEHHFTIGGYTDNTGTDAVNTDLSQRRAAAVRDYLVVHGVSPNAITVVGYGSTKPVADNKTTEGRAMNRRVEIIVDRDQTAHG